MTYTDATLLEQMRINDVEIAQRKELLHFTDTDVEILKQHKGIVENNLDPIITEFYAKQTSFDEISLLIGDADTLTRLRTAQTRYIRDLFSGFYDLEYVNNRLRIGLVHKRIGVDPKLYVSAVLTLKTIIIKHIQKDIDDSGRLTQLQSALDKLLHFDIAFVFDTYIRSLVFEIELAKTREEKYSRSLEQKVAERTMQLEALSRKDGLTNLFNARTLYEYLRRDINQAKRTAQPVSVAYFDLDKFKQVNDQQGHLKGDEILIQASNALLKLARETDSPCRYGGDEFCIILPSCDLKGAEKFAKRLIKEFSKASDEVTLSIGIVQTGPEEFMAPDDLIMAADKKMYKAKKHEGHFIAK
ncbi:GGDEF domain-containing protein [Pseudomonadota bacterium]